MFDRSVLAQHQGEFLRHSWQKKPLLIRGAFPGGLAGISGDELAGLACQEGVESRLVIQHGPKLWETRHGPFEESVWATLPAKNWTVLVQAVDRLLPEVSQLRDHFRFLPNWRIDDIMISYAADQGGVGPHTDHYDVFLIQGQGRRCWEIGAEPLVEPELEPDLDMKILKHFQAAQSFVLEPGDMLYLPPGFAHQGTAQGESITYSVGFRAPQQKEMLLSYLQFWQELGAGERFYTDPTLPEDREPGLILPAELGRLRSLLLDALQDEALFHKWIGGFLTEPRSFHEAPARGITASQLQSGLEHGRAMDRAEGGKFAFYFYEEKLYLAVEGECLVLDPGLTELCALLSRQQAYTATELMSHAGRLGFSELLSHLWRQGYVRWADE